MWVSSASSQSLHSIRAQTSSQYVLYIWCEEKGRTVSFKRTSARVIPCSFSKDSGNCATAIKKSKKYWGKSYSLSQCLFAWIHYLNSLNYQSDLLFDPVTLQKGLVTFLPLFCPLQSKYNPLPGTVHLSWFCTVLMMLCLLAFHLIPRDFQEITSMLRKFENRNWQNQNGTYKKLCWG